jgi:phosphoesterase RecJ-like protein
MTVSASINGAEALKRLRGAASVLLTGPASPDGDSIGACLALARALKSLGLAVDVAGEPGWRYTALPDAGSMIPEPVGHWDTVVILDGDRHRLSPAVEAVYARANTRAIIDHHASTHPSEYDWAWVDGEATSTCQMVYEALVEAQIAFDLDTATLLHLGSIFDTGCFRYDNTTPSTLAMAADLIGRGVDHAGLVTRVIAARRWRGLKATSTILSQAEQTLNGALVVATVPLTLQQTLHLEKDDLEGVVEALADVVGVQAGALLVERPDGTCKVSLRSRADVDVRAVAQSLEPSGGGHRKAAGAHTQRTLEQARSALIDAVAAQIRS